MPQIQLGAIDYAILIVYFAFVLGIGFALRRYVRSSEDFFLSGRSIPAWVAGLAFLSANLGAQEVIGMAASGAKYGIATSHFYWVGAIPAMVFVGVFMMPFYYGSRARSVPEYLKLRFDEKTRALQRHHFAAMTVFSSGISMYAMAQAARAACSAGTSTLSVVVSAVDRAGLHLPRRPHPRDLQRGAAVLPDRVRLRSRSCCSGCSDVGGWTGLTGAPGAGGDRRRIPGRCLEASRGATWRRPAEPDGRRVVRHGDGPRLRAVVRLLVHRLPRRAAGDGGGVDAAARRTPLHRRRSRRCCSRSS